VIRFWKETLNEKADALSRRLEHQPHKVIDESSSLLRSDQIQFSSFQFAALAAASHIELTILRQVRAVSEKNDEYQSLKSALANDSPTNRDLTLDDELIWYKNRLYISNHDETRLRILEQDHDSKIAGHWEHAKTMKLISRN
jgi:hypothetical protein